MAKMQGIVLIYACFQAVSALFIGNFPQSRLNRTVLPMETQLDIFARIFSRYDIVAVPNIRAPSEINMAVEILKQHNSNYMYYLSTMMDKPTLPIPEQFGLIYRSDIVTVSDDIRDQPTGALSFRVEVNSTGQEFVLSIVHMASTGTREDLELLPAAYDRIKNYFSNENVLFVGDFNTMSVFVTEAEYQSLTVTTDPNYQWYIQWSDNTITLSILRGVPPRFLARGDINNWIEPDSAKVFNTIEFFNLTEPEAAGMGVNMPVELELREPILRQ